MLVSRPNITEEEFLSKYRMYVVADRSCMPIGYAGVQAGHAAIEYALLHSETPSVKKWNEADKTLIYLDASQEQMNSLIEKFESKDLKHHTFYEPDMNNQRTAIAFEPVQTKDGFELFEGLKTLR